MNSELNLPKKYDDGLRPESLGLFGQITQHMLPLPAVMGTWWKDYCIQVVKAAENALQCFVQKR